MQAQGGAAAATTAAEDVGVVRCRAVDLSGYELGESCHLRAGAVAIERGVFASLFIDLVADVALIRFDHVSAQTEARHQSANGLTERRAEEVFGTTVGGVPP